MSESDLLILLAVVAQAIWSLVQRLRKRSEHREVDQAIAEPPAVIEDSGGWQATMLAHLDALGQQIEALRRAQAEALAGLRGSADVLAEAAQRAGQAGLATLEAELSTLRGQVALGQFAAVDARLASVKARLGRYRQAVQVVANEARWRQRPDQPAALADAEVVARGLLAPLRDFLVTHGQPSPLVGPVVTVTHESPLWTEILPSHPVIGVPDDLKSDPARWAEVAFGVAMAIQDHLPGFLREIKQLSPPAGPPGLPAIYNRQLYFDLNAATAHWMPTFTLDALVVMLLGPAGLRGLLAGLREQPERAHHIEVASDGRHLNGTPPAHLRMVVATRYLERSGFPREAEALRRVWDGLVGEVEVLVCPTLEGQEVALPIALLEVRAQQALAAFTETTWSSLGGYPWSAVPGLAMSPGRWVRVRARAAELVAGTPFHDDPVVVVAAAIEAAAGWHGAEGALGEAVRRSLRAVPVRAAGRATPHPSDPARDLRDALVLSVLLGSKPLGPRRPR